MVLLTAFVRLMSTVLFSQYSLGKELFQWFSSNGTRQASKASRDVVAPEPVHRIIANGVG